MVYVAIKGRSKGVLGVKSLRNNFDCFGMAHEILCVKERGASNDGWMDGWIYNLQ